MPPSAPRIETYSVVRDPRPLHECSVNICDDLPDGTEVLCNICSKLWQKKNGEWRKISWLVTYFKMLWYSNITLPEREAMKQRIKAAERAANRYQIRVPSGPAPGSAPRKTTKGK